MKKLVLILLIAPFLAGCPTTLFDGQLDCPLGTDMCLRAKAQYDACPTCVWEKVQGAAVAVSYAKSVICASGVVVPAASAACIPTRGQVTAFLDQIATRVESGGGDIDELGQIAVAGYKAAGQDEKAAALAVVLEPAK